MTYLVAVAFFLLGAWAALRARRKATARRVTRQYLASRPAYPQGLYLERTGTPFDAGHRNTNGKLAERQQIDTRPHLRVVKGGRG